MNVPRFSAAVCAALTSISAAFAQGPAPAPQQPGSMTQQQINEEMLKELRAIRQLLERLTAPQQRPRPTTARVAGLKGYALGRADAPLTMVEFTDLQCPFCREYVTVTFEEIRKNWIDTGKLRYVSRDFPLEIHPQAIPAARAARCAGEQGKFWDMRLSLMRNANLLSPDYISRTAADLKLDAKAFGACAASNKYDAEINAEIEEGTQLGIEGTPTFVVGKTAADSVEGPVIVGALPYAAFDAKLKELSGGK